MNENKLILKLVIDFLEDYSDVLGNDGCNDWRVPSKYSEKEANIIHTLMYDFDEREGNPEIFNNIGVVNMLISKLKDLAK